MTLPKLDPVDVNLVHERVYGALKRAVIGGAFLPGQKVTVREVAARFVTSPMPVREAIRRLVAQQAFEALPNRAVRVPAFSPEKIRDLCRVRCVVEGTAAAWAAARATPALARELQALYRAELAALEADDLPALLRADRQLHASVQRAAGAPSLLPCCEMLDLQVGPYLGVLHCDARLRQLLRHHGALVAALRRRDAEAARAAMAANIAQSAEHIIELWSRRQAAPARPRRPRGRPPGGGRATDAA